MTYQFNPRGVCARSIIFDVEDGIIRELTFQGGCPGNLLGISKLVVGMPVEEVITRLEGIRCGYKATSCPDQLSQALKLIPKDEKEPT